MSTALVRQALELVDDEERVFTKNKKGSRHRRSPGQDHKHPYKQKSKETVKKATKTSDELAEENVRKLLALSQPAADSSIAGKIVERAVKRKALAEKIEIPKEEPKSILFPEESFKSFEKQYFCS